MKDDYLWDGSGEPDPEIQNLEQILRPYRHQRPAPEMPALPAHTRRSIWPGLAAAAALILMALAGVWVFTNRSENETAPPQVAESGDKAPASNQETTDITSGGDTAKSIMKNGTGHEQHIRKTRPASGTKPRKPVTPAPAVVEDSSAQLIATGFLDEETIKHLEKAQLLLIAFRNLPASPDEANADLAYEKEKSRRLLNQNARLLQEARVKHNLPAEELLGSLEPLLLDIANLSDQPSAEEINAIKDRMQKKEMVATLQVYAGQLISRND
ncbi:MAG TPA: hypothetical protein VNO70_01385 [Blastocatellia bacterium]|nr:hypothetical protein [Blastocatellia bacterium]